MPIEEVVNESAVVLTEAVLEMGRIALGLQTLGMIIVFGIIKMVLGCWDYFDDMDNDNTAVVPIGYVCIEQRHAIQTWARNVSRALTKHTFII